jgi:serine/threonine protein phosphatase PrpC
MSKEGLSCAEMAAHLTHAALMAKSSDNITVVVTKL